MHIVQEKPGQGEKSEVFHRRSLGQLGHGRIAGLEGPRDKSRETAGRVLEVADAGKVFQPVLDGLAETDDHGGGAAKAEPVGLGHDRDPFVGRALVGRNRASDRVGQDLRPAPGQRGQPRSLEFGQDLGYGQAFQSGQKRDFRRRKAMVVAEVAEAKPRRDGHAPLAQEQLGELHGLEMGEGLGNLGPDEHGGVGRRHVPAGPGQPLDQGVTPVLVDLPDLAHAILGTV